MLKICIYIGINAHVTPVDAQTDRQTDTHGKVEQYSAEAESAIVSRGGCCFQDNEWPACISSNQISMSRRVAFKSFLFWSFSMIMSYFMETCQR